MALRIGIGIISYNRKDVLAETLARVRAHTKLQSLLVVADDGSDDGTADFVRSQGITVITGRNRGVAWNKNRALFLLAEIAHCDAIVLLEDDSHPTIDGWEQDWVLASQRWGHANLAGDWFSESFVRGTGTVDDPIMSTNVSAQCSSFSRAALLYGGYLDSRFWGFGQEHVEHTRRLVRVGYGGTHEDIDGEVRPLYKLLKSPIRVTRPPTFGNPVENEQSRLLCRQLIFDQSHRVPWRDDSELTEFRTEMQNALRNTGA
jgi:glycosyltransferase involved in cell wall biosynthesis